MKTIIFMSLLVIGLVQGCQSKYTSNQQVSSVKPRLSIDQRQRWDLMVGRWYGSQPTKQGGTRQQLMERYSDGTYKIILKHISLGGKERFNSEVGQWGVVGPVYFSIFRGWVEEWGVKPSDTSDPYNYDGYEIIELDTKVFKYKSYSSGVIYTLRKVGKEFIFPTI